MTLRFASAAGAVVALAFVSLPAAAQMAPGLWEHTVKFKSQSGDMERQVAEAQARMASLPPDQRKMVEEMMAKRGMSMNAQGMTARSCVTKEQAARMEPLPMNSDGKCTQDVVSRTSNSLKIKWACGGQEPSTGEGEIRFSSEKAFTGHAVMNGMRNGKPERTDVDTTGHWLASDCGDIKPRGTAKP
ncbi:MAG TPA: DUF3617 domain-containing protein [Caldimonas sp.]|nr:DUF3617 domain-containing protein [Caldimonas sp.]